VGRELPALDVHPTNLHQLQDAILSIWVNISKECFQHLVESMPRRNKAVLKAKGGQTQYYNGVPNNSLGECIILYPSYIWKGGYFESKTHFVNQMIA